MDDANDLTIFADQLAPSFSKELVGLDNTRTGGGLTAIFGPSGTAIQTVAYVPKPASLLAWIIIAIDAARYVRRWAA